MGFLIVSKIPRLIQETNQSWLPLPFSWSAVILKKVMCYVNESQLVATVTAFLAVTVGFLIVSKIPRLIQETNQSWLPLPYSWSAVILKKVMCYINELQLGSS